MVELHQHRIGQIFPSCGNASSHSPLADVLETLKVLSHQDSWQAVHHSICTKRSEQQPSLRYTRPSRRVGELQKDRGSAFVQDYARVPGLCSSLLGRASRIQVGAALKGGSNGDQVAELLVGVSAPVLYWEQGHEWLFGDPVRFQVSSSVQMRTSYAHTPVFE